MWKINYCDYRFYSGTNVHKQDLDDSNVFYKENLCQKSAVLIIRIYLMQWLYILIMHNIEWFLFLLGLYTYLT